MRKELVLEGGVAFGTGEHPTTHSCLKWLDRTIRQSSTDGRSEGVTVLDYGAGSGILGLAALLMGAGESVGVEVDRDAISAAHRNARANSLDFQCFLPPRETDPTTHDLSTEYNPLPPRPHKFDITVANILAGPLTQLAPTIAGLTREGGLLALSGVLAGQEQHIFQAYSPFFPDISVEGNDSGWLLLTGTRLSETETPAAVQ